MNDSQQIVTTLQQVANHFGRHVQTVKSWRGAGMPGEPGRWDLSAIELWRNKNVRDDDGLTEEKRQKLLAESALLESRKQKIDLELAKAREQIYSPDDLERRLRWFADQVMKLADKLIERISHDTMLQDRIARGTYSDLVNLCTDAARGKWKDTTDEECADDA